MKICFVKGCLNKFDAKGFCHFHYIRWRAGITLDMPRREPIEKCTIPLCDNKHKSRSFCDMHLYRFYKYGDPNKTIRNPAGMGTIAEGYRLLTRNGRRIKEHRFFMENFLGRRLKSSEIVHHIDGNRLNNAIENLEILTQSEHVKKHLTTTFRNKTHKQCTHCRKIKPRYLFGKINQKNLDPNRTTCKECANIKQYVSRHKKS